MASDGPDGLRPSLVTLRIDAFRELQVRPRCVGVCGATGRSPKPLAEIPVYRCTRSDPKAVGAILERYLAGGGDLGPLRRFVQQTRSVSATSRLNRDEDFLRLAAAELSHGRHCLVEKTRPVRGGYSPAQTPADERPRPGGPAVTPASLRSPPAEPPPPPVAPPPPAPAVPAARSDQDRQAAVLEAAAREDVALCEECTVRPAAEAARPPAAAADQDRQAAVLEAAAREGVALCEECTPRPAAVSHAA